VVDVEPASAPGWAVLTVVVERVWRGDFASTVPLRALVSLPVRPSLSPDPGAGGGDLSGLVHQRVVVFTPQGPTDGEHPQVRLEGEERVYVQAGERLSRASYFLRGEPDPAPENLASLRAAVEKAGPAD
ncbi:MAG: hypothetical protein M1337_04650, partial [Actinobacteria bacterium]|nr:hypothetical protein [Actinomycetota bacterium]